MTSEELSAKFDFIFTADKDIHIFTGTDVMLDTICKGCVFKGGFGANGDTVIEQGSPIPEIQVTHFSSAYYNTVGDEISILQSAFDLLDEDNPVTGLGCPVWSESLSSTTIIFEFRF